MCMSCQNSLYWYDLIPFISFFILRGRCRHCKTRISAIYPLVEVFTGLIFVALFLKFQDIFFISLSAFIVTYAYYAAMFSLLIVIAFYDLRHKIIPDTLSFIFGLLAFIGLFFFTSYGFYPHIPSIFEFFGALVALPLFLLWLVSGGRWMGLGDAKLALGLGWMLGISKAISGVVLGFWIGAAAGILLILFLKNHKIKSEIPFAPFLVLGAFLSFFFELHLLGI